MYFLYFVPCLYFENKIDRFSFYLNFSLPHLIQSIFLFLWYLWEEKFGRKKIECVVVLCLNWSFSLLIESIWYNENLIMCFIQHKKYFEKSWQQKHHDLPSISSTTLTFTTRMTKFNKKSLCEWMRTGKTRKLTLCS